jgi:hypothetical protein
MPLEEAMRLAVLALAAIALLAADPASASRRDSGADIVYFWEDASRPGPGFGWSYQPQPSNFGSVRPRGLRQACELAVGRTMRRDNSAMTYAMLMVDACVRRGGGL